MYFTDVCLYVVLRSKLQRQRRLRHYSDQRSVVSHYSYSTYYGRTAVQLYSWSTTMVLYVYVCFGLYAYFGMSLVGFFDNPSSLTKAVSNLLIEAPLLYAERGLRSPRGRCLSYKGWPAGTKLSLNMRIQGVDLAPRPPRQLRGQKNSALRAGCFCFLGHGAQGPRTGRRGHTDRLELNSLLPRRALFTMR